MNIGIDAMYVGKEKTGIGTYIAKVIEGLNKIDRENTYILYSNEEIVLDFKLNDNFIIKQNIKGKRTIWIYYTLPKLLKEDNIDVFWGPQYQLPKRNKYTRNIKFCVTIADLAIEKLKNVGALKNTIVHKLFLKKSLNNADEIIAISNATKKDIIDLYNIPEKKIHVTYLGTSFLEEKGNITKEDKVNIRKKYEIDNVPFLFFLSTIEPRKNIKTLVRAFEYVKDKGNKDLKLILAGRLGWKYEEILEEIEKCKYKKDIIRPGYITNKEKKCLFEEAVCFTYPSLYEGFGLPILEAMANKGIVLTSNNSSLPEVGGDVAFYYKDVLNFEELGEKIMEIMSLSEEEKKNKIDEGLKQVNKFSWEDCTKETFEILKTKKN